MQILLAAATSMEIEPYLGHEPEADILITGLGTPSAMYHLQKRMVQIDYDLVIQAGIAGSFGEACMPGTVCLVRRDCFADLGVEEKRVFSSLFDMGLAEKNETPFIDGWMVNNSPVFETTEFKNVDAVTVNKITDDPFVAEQTRLKFMPDIESMEGAALHYICIAEKIPFLQLRSISNFVGERDKNKWVMKESIANLNTGLLELISVVKQNPHWFGK